MITFLAQIEKHPNINGAYVKMPFDMQETFGAKRVKVRATFDGVNYRGSVVTMGGSALLGITKDIRRQIQKQPGDMVEVTIVKDVEERIIDLAKDVKQTFENAGILEAWNKQSFTKQSQGARWIESAKKQDTRQRRIKEIITKFASGN
jgi:Domain of unknown function (DUF1905)/Bacteriocin-protection, YdeI or OmpD-Associated